MSEVAKKLAKAKQQLTNLKNEVKSVQAKRVEGFNGISSCVKAEAPAVSAPPKSRRVLRDHFGKVYALHWSGDIT